MKNFIISVAAMGIGGAAWFGTDSPDFDRTIDRPPAAVYAAFAALPERTVTRAAPDGSEHVFSVRTAKVEGESIDYEVLLDGRPVITAEFDFAPAGEGGNATRMTAEFDIDAVEIGAAFETEAGVALALVPDAYFDRQFAAVMEDFAKDIEAGRPLVAPGEAEMGVRQRVPAPSVQARRAEMRRSQREAVRPMNDARPMVDPNAAAEAHRRGQPDPNGRYGY